MPSLTSGIFPDKKKSEKRRDTNSRRHGKHDCAFYWGPRTRKFPNLGALFHEIVIGRRLLCKRKPQTPSRFPPAASATHFTTTYSLESNCGFFPGCFAFKQNGGKRGAGPLHPLPTQLVLKSICSPVLGIIRWLTLAVPLFPSPISQWYCTESSRLRVRTAG